MNNKIPTGPIGHINTGPAIGFCPLCHTNSRETTMTIGIYDCPTCFYVWLDERTGIADQTYSINSFVKE